MLKLTQQFLAGRIGTAGVADLFFARYTDDDSAANAVVSIFEESAPPLADGLGAPAAQVSVLTVPAEPAGTRFESIAQRALNCPELKIAAGADDIAIFREFLDIRLSRLPHVGPQARAAFELLAKRDHSPPHTRTDIEEWLTPS